MRKTLVLLATLALALAADDADEAARAKAVRMRTSRQLREIFDDLGIAHPAGAKTQTLRDIALKEDAVTRYEEKYPEKRKRKRSGGAGGMPDFGGPPPEGMDPAEWAKLMAQMRGDFSYESDPEKKRILEKLAARGMSLGGGMDMSIEQLRNMEKMLDGINVGDLGGDNVGKDPPPGGEEKLFEEVDINMDKEEM